MAPGMVAVVKRSGEPVALLALEGGLFLVQLEDGDFRFERPSALAPVPDMTRSMRRLARYLRGLRAGTPMPERAR